MSGSTPGPWLVEASRGERVVIIAAGVNEYGDGPAEYVVDASNGGGGIKKANARLICAAPVMLAALKSIQAHRGDEPTCDCDRIIDCEQAIDAALAEAFAAVEGE